VADHNDLELRRAAIERLRDLQRTYDDVIPLYALRDGFPYRGRRVSFGSFYSGIFRLREMTGPAALALVTAPPRVAARPRTRTHLTRQAAASRTASATLGPRRREPPDNAAMLAAHRLLVPLIYFRGIAAGQYAAVAPVFITAVDQANRIVEFEAALPLADTTEAGLVSPEDTRRYATREALYRLHQHRFRVAVLRAYETRCAVCALREAALLQAAHIVDDRDPRGGATVDNGISLCAIHHLAYDRNLLGIDPKGIVHIASRLLEETDGPMLSQGLQGFHGGVILQPRRSDERPNPERLKARYNQFLAVA
jgi:putative restriction endonuclease